MFSWLKNQFFPLQKTTDPVVIYHHIAKTGGTSLRKVVQANYRGKALLELYGPNRGYVDWYERYYSSLSPKRKASIQCIAAHSAHYIIPVIDRPFRVFTLLRNPVDRVISLYYFTRILAKQGAGKGSEMGIMLDTLGWNLADIYINAGLKGRIAPEQRPLLAPFFNGQSRAILGPHLDATVMPFEQGEPAVMDVFQTTLNDVINRHYELGITESYETSVRYFARIFRWRRVFFQHKNQTKNRPKVEDIPIDVREMILSFNQMDATLHQKAERTLRLRIEKESRTGD
jgi:hypothetical protein